MNFAGVSAFRQPCHIANMGNGWAIVIAGVVIAAAIMLGLRWQIVPATAFGSAYRLDSWTGEIVVCEQHVGRIILQCAP